MAVDAPVPGQELPSISSAAKVTSDFPFESPNKREIKQSAGDEASSDSVDEEVENYTMTRMLEDGTGTGRLLYIGDSSTMSFLQLIRMIVETASGPSTFSMDIARNQIIETQFKVPPSADFTNLLPDKTTSTILVESFFINTHGIVEAFDEKTFCTTLDRCYTEPLTIDHTWLCLFHLVLAIGLCLATPKVGSREAEVINSILSKHPNQSEISFWTAKSLSNSLDGLEDASFWSVQVLALMSLYMLIRAKRNTAYAYCGRAVRSAYALGIHREETLVIFSPEEQAARRRIWRSLFVLDCFLAVHLGRPVAIAAEESSGEILLPINRATGDGTQPKSSPICAAGLEASVRSCHVMNTILRSIYQQRKVSVTQAQSIVDECKKWPENLPSNLYWTQASAANIRLAIAILHPNLAYCHSIILLTRPFFLYLLSIEIQHTRLNRKVAGPKRWEKMKIFSDSCISASISSVALCENAYQGGYLPRLNPFPTYSLFAAALIIFANEFARPGTNTLSAQAMHNAVTILEYCGENDPQAERAATILKDFRQAMQSESQPHHFNVNGQMNRVPFSTREYLNPTPTMAHQGISTTVVSSGTSPEKRLPGSFPSLTTSTTTFPSSNPSDSQSNPFLLGQLPDEYPFSGLLNLESMGMDGNSSADEDFDFDSFWDWTGTVSVQSPGSRSTTQGVPT